MGLKEPVILNDLVGWQLRDGEGRQIATVFDGTLPLLARSFAPGKAAAIKPSYVCNATSPVMPQLRPQARALPLYALLPVFLGSVARQAWMAESSWWR
jgi:hypothetical protein